jgi:uncharacterized membrane protein
MIQRRQTLWLLLSLICAAFTFKFPFFNGTIANATGGISASELTAMSNLPLLVLTVAIILVSLLAIFLFNDRKLQLRVTFGGLLLSVVLIVVYFYDSRKFEPGGRISLTSLFTVLTVLGFYMALKGIRKDQKLIKDLNRLR